MDQQFQAPPTNQVSNVPPTNFSEPSEMIPKPNKKFGPIVALLIIIFIIVIVILYFLASNTNVNLQESTQPLPTNNSSAVISEITTQQEVTPIINTSDEVNSLQADLDAAIDGIEAQSI